MVCSWKVFVPLKGVIFLNTNRILRFDRVYLCFRPLKGGYILKHAEQRYLVQNWSFRPLKGGYILKLKQITQKAKEDTVFVPLKGVIFLNLTTITSLVKVLISFRPLKGGYILKLTYTNKSKNDAIISFRPLKGGYILKRSALASTTFLFTFSSP